MALFFTHCAAVSLNVSDDKICYDLGMGRQEKRRETVGRHSPTVK